MENILAIFWILILIQGIIFGGFCSYIASQKHRDPGGWFFLGFFFSFLAILALIAVPNRQVTPQTAAKAPKPQPTSPNQTVGNNDNNDQKKCPYCAEVIKAEAIKCRYCGSDLDYEIESQESRVVTTMECPACHKEIPNTALMCKFCQTII